MPKVVLDTNVLISALIKKGRPRELLDRIIENELTLVLSENILNELVGVMHRDKFRKYVTKSEIKKFVNFLLRIGKVVKPKSKFRVVKDEPEDDIVINTAYDCGVEYIVTGDKHLLKIKRYKGIRILSVTEMLEKL